MHVSPPTLPHDVRPRRRLAVVLGLAMSATALAGVAYVEADPLVDLHPVSEHVGATTPSNTRAHERGTVHVGASPVATATEDHAAAVRASPARPVSPIDAVAVPDLVGTRLSAARRVARAAGLRVIARDEYGARIPASEAPYYRVREQTTVAGTTLPRGSAIEVRARVIGGYASGY